jgi:hypothetical protein
MKIEIKITELNERDVSEAWDLVREVFDTCVAPDYSKEGNEKYYSFVNLEYIRNWKKEDRICLVAKLDSKIMGIIDLKDTNHLTMFYEVNVAIREEQKGLNNRPMKEYGDQTRRQRER